MDDAIAQQLALTVLPRIERFLPDEPSTLREAQASHEWPQWEGTFKREMDGQIARGRSSRDLPHQGPREVSYYLGCLITRDREAKTMTFDQHRYVRTITEQFGIDKTSVIPAAAGTRPLSEVEGPQTGAEIEKMRGVP